MIESNIINWIDLGDSMQSLDIYGKKKMIKFFNFIHVLVSFTNFSIFFYIILKFFFFLQIMMLTLVNLEDKDDSTIVILKYISKVIFVQEIITDKEIYKIRYHNKQRFNLSCHSMHCVHSYFDSNRKIYDKNSNSFIQPDQCDHNELPHRANCANFNYGNVVSFG